MKITITLWTSLLLVVVFQQIASPIEKRAQNRSTSPTSSSVEFIWSGAVTHDSVRINAKIMDGVDGVRLALSTNAEMTFPLYSDTYTPDPNMNRVLSITMSGLIPATQYYYAIESDGVLDMSNQGRFRTFANGPFSFRFVMSGDASRGSDKPVFNTIRALDPDFFLNTGDFFYADIAENNVDLFREAYWDTLTSPPQATLYRNVPIVYMWDDHDYAHGNSDMLSPPRPAARLAYQEHVPHYPLVAGSGDVPIYQSFHVGRVRFILTDLRSQRTPAQEPDGPTKSMMGTVQKAWFKQELLQARDQYALILWLSTSPWIANPSTRKDRWGAYVTERAELANFIEDNGIDRLVMLAGDAHMVALDDGTNNIYSDSGNPMFPVLHAASLGRSGSIKGGPYSHGPYKAPSKNDGQFAIITITDSGGEEICLHFDGRRLPKDAVETISLLDWGRCFLVPSMPTATPTPTTTIPDVSPGEGPSLYLPWVSR